MTPNELDHLIGKYLAGECTEEESAFIRAWYARLGIPHPESSEALDEQADAVKTRIEAHLRSYAARDGHHPRRQHRFLFVRYAAVAASITLLVAAAVYFTSNVPSSPETTAANHATQYEVVENYSNDYKRIFLPDGSIVRLLPQGRVRYNADDHSPSRELYLEGEAYFDIAPNRERPFYVYAGGVVTRVVGTSFIIRARGEEPEVTVAVKTGKVTVYSRSAAYKKTVLASNEAATYNRMTEVVARQTELPALEKTQQDKLRLTEMHFEETPVTEVLRELSTAYDIAIDFQEEVLANCVLTSSFYEEGLYDRVDVICTAIGATYKIVGGEIIIESKGCNRKQY